MWWLSFPEGVVIIEAASLAHARLLAAQCAFNRASQFVEGYPINPDLAALVPGHSIGTDALPDRGPGGDRATEIRPAEVRPEIQAGTGDVAVSPTGVNGAKPARSGIEAGFGHGYR